MDNLKEVFSVTTISAFEFLEKEYAYKRIPKVIDIDSGLGEEDSIVRYMGTVVAVDVIWHHDTASIDVLFTELSDGLFPKTRYFWGDKSGKSRAINLYTLVVMNKGDAQDYLLGDMAQVGFARIKKREELIKTDMVSILQNLKNLSIEFATEIIRGDLAIFPVAMTYQQNMLTKRP